MTDPGTDAEPEPPPDDWVIVLRVRRRTAPAEVRVKRLLKWADQLGLRCILVRNPTAEELREAEEWL